MDCQSCEAMLLELVCGELAPHAQSELRAHLSRCAQCSAAFERLSAGQRIAEQLTLEEPPPELSLRLMQAARAQPVAPKALDQAAAPFWDELFTWVRRFTSSHQVAMATVTVLIIGVSVLSLDQMASRPVATGTSVVNPDHEGEAAPSAALQPAKPLDLKMDPRAGRIYAKGDRDEAARARAAGPAGAKDLATAPSATSPRLAVPSAPPSAAPAAATEAVAEAAKRTAPATDNALAVGDHAASDSLAQREGAKPANQPAPPAAVSSKAEAAAADDKSALAGLARSDLAEKKALGAELEPGPFPAAPAASGGGASLGAARGAADEVANPYAPAPARSVADVASSAQRSRSAPTGGAVASSTVDASGPFEQGLARYRAGDYAAARSLLLRASQPPASAAQRVSALLFAARAARALARCSDAVVQYRTLVMSYSTTPEAGAALDEGVGCYDQLGRGAAALALLTDAARMPSLAALANRALAARRAAPATHSAPAAAASAPAAGP